MQRRCSDLTEGSLPSRKKWEVLWCSSKRIALQEVSWLCWIPNRGSQPHTSWCCSLQSEPPEGTPFLTIQALHWWFRKTSAFCSRLYFFPACGALLCSTDSCVSPQRWQCPGDSRSRTAEALRGWAAVKYSLSKTSAVKSAVILLTPSLFVFPFPL